MSRRRYFVNWAKCLLLRKGQGWLRWKLDERSLYTYSGPPEFYTVITRATFACTCTGGFR